MAAKKAKVAKTKSAKPAKAAPAAGDGTQVRSWSGGKAGTATLDGHALGEKVKVRLLREAVRMYEANQRQGTHSTKTRGETNFSERKPYKQKGTGNARRGDFNSPLLKKGGVIFGPRPRDYSYALPRRALREALRSALAGKLRDGEVGTLQAAEFGKPSTKLAAAALQGLGCEGSVCLVLEQEHESLWKSFRNIPRCKITRASDVNAMDVLAHRNVVFVDGAWGSVLKRLGPDSHGTGEAES